MAQNASSLIQGPLSQMHDMHGSFIPYQRPCCGTCKRPKPCGGKCGGGGTACTTGAAGTTYTNPVTGQTQQVNINPYLQATGTPGVSSLKLNPGYLVNPAPIVGVTAPVPQPVVPPNCDEDLILCELLGSAVGAGAGGRYLSNDKGQPVYNIPNHELLPQAYENALNGFAPCTFDEHVYDGLCTCCGNKCGSKNCGGSQACKYKQGHFAITIEASYLQDEVSNSNFVLAANGIRNRVIYVTRGGRYYFTFMPCSLAVDPRATIDGEPNPTAGEPLPESSGGVKIKKTDIPLTFQGTSMIFTGNNNPIKPIASDAPSQRLPMDDTKPIALYQTGWLYIGPQTPPVFQISGYLDGSILTPARTLLANELARAVIQVVVVQPTTTKFPFPT